MAKEADFMRYWTVEVIKHFFKELPKAWFKEQLLCQR